MKVMIVVKLEISDHGGYCSGAECEYVCKNTRYIRKIPDEDINKDINDPYWLKLLPEPQINDYGSGYCELSKECSDNGLGYHEYKYTILKIIILDN